MFRKWAQSAARVLLEIWIGSKTISALIVATQILYVGYFVVLRDRFKVDFAGKCKMQNMVSEFPSVTLPIDRSDGGLRMDADEARSLGEFLNEQYVHANPFPHVVLENFLPDALAQDLVANFPVEEVSNERTFKLGYAGQNKRQVLPEMCSPFNRELFWFLNSRSMLQFLEGLTGIDGLLPDPYFEGGGFHETSRDGLLGIHADFRINNKLHVQRRINLLVYLNPEWDELWKGQLELWSRDMKQCVVRIPPTFNRCVVFSTESDTWHGHPDPLMTPDGVTRRSLAMYYYTASQNIYSETPNLSTMYVTSDVASAATKAEARSFRINQYLKDWLPPIASRSYFRIRNAIRRRARKE